MGTVQLKFPKPTPRLKSCRRWIRRRRTLGARRRETKAAGHVDPDTWQAIVEWYDYRCALCETAPREEQGHAVAIARGGTHEPGNVFPVCKRCNQLAGTLTVWPLRRHPWMREA